MDKDCIEDVSYYIHIYFVICLQWFVYIFQNILNNFHVTNKLMVVTRIFLLFQLITVFPLIMFILRSQAFMLILRNEAGSYAKIYGVNTIVLIICTTFQCLMPSIGNIIRYSGAMCGAVVVFVLPCLVAIAARKKEGRLTWWFTLAMLMIMALGIANLCAQFAI